MKSMGHMLAAMLVLSSVACAQEAEAPVRVYVNNLLGSDSADGRTPVAAGTSGPVRTFAWALRVARPGAHIELANTGEPYRETFQIEGYRLGSAGAPLVIEGNGATVSGLVRIPSEAWVQERDDIYSINEAVFAALAPLGGMPKSNWLWHWKRTGWWPEPEAPEIFILDGKPAPHAQSLDAIMPGGFYLNRNENPVRIRFRLPAGRSLGDCRVEVPGNHGVIINDDHVVIRNLASTYSSDDGFSTFLAASAVFYNVYGAFNCDQGLSLHNATTALVEGGLFERNGGCGIADVMNTQSVYIQCVVRRNMVSGMWLAGSSHTVQSSYLVDNRGAQITVCPGTRANIINSVIRARDRIETLQAGVDAQGDARIDRCTIGACTVGVQVTGRAEISNSLLLACEKALVSAVPGRTNLSANLFDPAGTVAIGPMQVALSSDGAKQASFASWLGGTRMAMPVLDNPFDGLAADAKGLRVGAHIAPRNGWRPEEAVEVIPVTVFTHGVGRATY